ncbi:MAG TPA: dihydrofolate reductase [Verrucomicrobiae bacterium]|nr:dihydrofolate reductase [Verrucomicrobiae bacterium]
MVLTRHPARLRREFPELFAGFTLGTRARSLRRPKQLHLPKVPGSKGTELRLQRSLLKLDPAEFARDVFICGGAQIYEQSLPMCSDLFLTLVKREVHGDAFFPPFEHLFDVAEEVRDTPEFRILHYVRRGSTRISARKASGTGRLNNR